MKKGKLIRKTRRRQIQLRQTLGEVITTHKNRYKGVSKL